MATSLKNLSTTTLKKGKGKLSFQIGLVVSDWNAEVTHAMRDAAIEFLKEHGIAAKNIIVHAVPGSFELALGAQWLAYQKKIDAVIAIGCVVQGETRHFDFICDACAKGIMEVGLHTNKPVIFGVLTPQNQEQALDRAGGKHGNKGIEAAETALKMLLLREKLF
jgi:6,7-dimethyl-8-ribityllumazine synthase